MKHTAPSIFKHRVSVFSLESKEQGFASLLLVSIIMMSLLMAVAISNWVTVQRRGDMQMRVAIKEMTLAQSAIQETRFRLLDGEIPLTLSSGSPTLFKYYIDSSTVTVQIEYQSFP
jgi:type II secretory pathway pseudopilin PulG